MKATKGILALTKTMWDKILCVWLCVWQQERNFTVLDYVNNDTNPDQSDAELKTENDLLPYSHYQVVYSVVVPPNFI